MARFYTVQKGDCLSSIAKKFGFSRWQAIYHHVENAEFRSKRPKPNIIFAGDRLFIPDRELRYESCATEQTHRFIYKKQKTFLTLMVQDSSGRPLEGKEYRLEVEGRKEPYKGTTGRKGRIDVQIAADASSGNLTVYSSGGGYSWPLDIGYLNPIDETSGAIARLQNLAVDLASDQASERLPDLLKAFQHEHNLPVTGELDDATRSKLTAVHDEGMYDQRA